MPTETPPAPRYGRRGPPAVARAEVLFVRTLGVGSMDTSARALLEHLDVPVLDARFFRRSGELFASRPPTPAGLLARLREWRFEHALRAGDAPVHLPNHHLARYGLPLRRPYVVTVHDAIRWRDLDGGPINIHPPGERDRRLLEADRDGIRRAAGVITVSDHSAAEIERVLGVPPGRIVVVPPGIDHERFRPGPAGELPVREPYLLFVGSEHPRKNLPVLLRALAELKAGGALGDLRLVKVGTPGGPEAPYRERTLAEMRRLGLDDDVHFTGRVRDDELVAWYRRATCLVLPSRAEGFGLPPVEAMACGCPVVAARAGALPETCGDAAVLVEPDDAPALARALQAVASDPELRERLRAAGLAHAARYRWDAAARATVAAYRRFLGEIAVPAQAPAAAAEPLAAASPMTP